MHPQQIWANYAVSDLARTRKFYTALGFKSNDPHQSAQLTSFFFGENDFVIHFFLRDLLKKSMQGEIAAPGNGNELMFTLSAETREAVDAWARKVETAGGTLVTQPSEFGEGWYGFVFTDPDGHRFNVFKM